jgi:hypothetical protein
MFHVSLYNADVTIPSPVPLPAVTAFDTRVEMQWPGVVDDPNRSGFYVYQIFRRNLGTTPWSYLGIPEKPNFVDTTVSPGTAYEYWFIAFDLRYNNTQRVFTVQTAPAGSTEPRRIGVRPTGTYWGAAGEQIDVQSGNLNYRLPLLTASLRGGGSVPIALNYNSQVWRKDSAGTWKYGFDIGYGFGWQLLAGSITPVYRDLWQPDHYVFADSSGAEYRLDVNDNGIWRSRESIFVTYDPVMRRLRFSDGSYWVMLTESSGSEDDAGTLYPGVMYDTNGNYLQILYLPGLAAPYANSSGRISSILDSRAPAGATATYTFHYSNTPLPRLGTISRYDGTALYTFDYFPINLRSPWDPVTDFGTAQVLYLIAHPPASTSQTFSYSAAGEMLSTMLPHGGSLRFSYRDFTFIGSRTVREIEYRYNKASTGSPERTHQFVRNASDSSLSHHLYSSLRDISGSGSRGWYLTPDRKLSIYEQYAADSSVMLRHDYGYASTAWGDQYVAALLKTIDYGKPTQKQSRIDQAMDVYGNIIETREYDFSIGSVWNHATVRILRHTYLNSGFIRNRLVTTTVQRGNEPVIPLVSNTYDGYSTCSLSIPPGGLAPLGGGSQPIPPDLRLHDSSNYGYNFTARGNPTAVTTFDGTTCIAYSITGAVIGVNGPQGKATSLVQAQPAFLRHRPSQLMISPVRIPTMPY